MAALLVGLSVMAVMMTMAMPLWSTAAKRAREDELVFRGEQYARAIGMYQRKYANALPPNLDVLVNEKFLRRKYLDPVTGGEFQALTGALGQATPGMGTGVRGGAPGAQTGIGGAQRPPAGGRAQTGFGTAQSGFGAAQTGAGRGLLPGGAAAQGRQGGVGAPFGAPGGIVGVASKSTEKSLRQYNGRGAYNEWTFIAVQRTQQAGAGAAGAQTPGQGAGRSGRPGERGAGPNPARGSGSFRPSTGTGGFRPPGGR
jgi:type II secretory pathway pseudopilin PulG